MGDNKSKLKKIKINSSVIVFIVLVIITIIFFQIVTNSYVSIANLIDILRTSSIVFIISVAMGIVIAGGGIDMSLAYIGGFTGIIVAYLIVDVGINIYLSMIIGIVIAGIIGLVNGIIVTKLGVSSFITTLGMQIVIVGLRNWLTKGVSRQDFPKEFLWIGHGSLFGIPILIYIMFFILILSTLLIDKSILGRRILAVGTNINTSRLSGISPAIYITLTHTIGALIVSVSGIIIISKNNVARVGDLDAFLLDALTISIFAKVLFRRISAIKIFVITVFMIMLTNGLTMIGFSSSVLNLVKGLILFIIIFLSNINYKVNFKNFFNFKKIKT